MFPETNLLISTGRITGYPTDDKDHGLLNWYVEEALSFRDSFGRAQPVQFWLMETYQIKEVNFEGLSVKENASHRTLKSQLPSPQYYSMSLGNIVSLLKMQLHGQEGFLLTNGKRNVFYINAGMIGFYAVSVLWNVDKKRWHIKRDRDGRELEAGDLICIKSLECD
jgi:hypothetical protein